MSFPVSSIYKQAKKILGARDVSEENLFERITEAVEILANSGDFDPLLGYVDICTTSRCIALPREVETVLAVNIAGEPSIGRDQFFRFHLNGPGEGPEISWVWEDRNYSSTWRDLAAVSKVVAFVSKQEDANRELWVYGYDSVGDWVRTKNANDEWVDGYQVPTVYGYALPDDDAPEFARITRVRKAVFVGDVRLASYDNDDTSGTLLGIYEWDDTDPQFRRIKINQDAEYVRVAFRRRVFQIRSLTDLIPLPSKTPLLMMLRALREYDNNELANGAGFEATARRLIEEAARVQQPPVVTPIQVNDRTGLWAHEDDID